MTASVSPIGSGCVSRPSREVARSLRLPGRAGGQTAPPAAPPGSGDARRRSTSGLLSRSWQRGPGRQLLDRFTAQITDTLEQNRRAIEAADNQLWHVGAYVEGHGPLRCPPPRSPAADELEQQAHGRLEEPTAPRPSRRTSPSCVQFIPQARDDLRVSVMSLIRVALNVLIVEMIPSAAVCVGPVERAGHHAPLPPTVWRPCHPPQDPACHWLHGWRCPMDASTLPGHPLATSPLHLHHLLTSHGSRQDR
jgi:hypothetical protein